MGKELANGEIASRVPDSIDDSPPRLLDKWVIDGRTVQGGEYGKGFGVSAFRDEPSGRFGYSEVYHTGDPTLSVSLSRIVSSYHVEKDIHEKGKDTLKSDRETPRDLPSCIVECQTDPVRDHDSLTVSIGQSRTGIKKLTKVIKDPENKRSCPR